MLNDPEMTSACSPGDEVSVTLVGLTFLGETEEFLYFQHGKEEGQTHSEREIVGGLEVTRVHSPDGTLVKDRQLDQVFMVAGDEMVNTDTGKAFPIENFEWDQYTEVIFTPKA